MCRLKGVRAVCSILIVFFSILILVNSCQGDRNFNFPEKNFSNFQDEIELLDARVLSFAVDQETNNSLIHSIQWQKTANGEVFSYLYSRKNTLFVYKKSDSDSSAEKIKFLIDGSEGVGQLQIYDKHYYISSDSILIFNSLTGKLHLCNNQGKSYRYYSLYDLENSDQNNTYPFSFKSAPHIRVADAFYFACVIGNYSTDFKNFNGILKINLNGTIERFAPMPKLYNEAFWGYSLLYSASVDYNPHTKNLLVDFPIDPNVYEYNTFGEIVSTHSIGSKFFNKIVPYDWNVEMGFSNSNWDVYEKVNKHSSTQFSFFGVVFNPHQDLYYRLAFMPDDIEKIRLGKFGKDFSISIFDKDFKKIGETEVFDGEKYNIGNLFITDKGIAIGRKDLNAEDEDHIHFSLFEAQKIRN